MIENTLMHLHELVIFEALLHEMCVKLQSWNLSWSSLCGNLICAASIRPWEAETLNVSCGVMNLQPTLSLLGDDACQWSRWKGSGSCCETCVSSLHALQMVSILPFYDDTLCELISNLYLIWMFLEIDIVHVIYRVRWHIGMKYVWCLTLYYVDFCW